MTQGRVEYEFRYPKVLNAGLDLWEAGVWLCMELKFDFESSKR